MEEILKFDKDTIHIIRTEVVLIKDLEDKRDELALIDASAKEYNEWARQFPHRNIPEMPETEEEIKRLDEKIKAYKKLKVGEKQNPNLIE
jgi:hypothetical protein